MRKVGLLKHKIAFSGTIEGKLMGLVLLILKL